MPGTGEVTTSAPVGAGEASVTDLISGAREARFDFRKEMLYVTQADGRQVEYAYDTVATVTFAISGAVSTVTVST